MVFEEKSAVDDDSTRFEIDEAIEKTTAQSSRFQILVQLSCCYVILTISYNIYLSRFGGDEPPWRCVSNSTDSFCKINSNTTFSITSQHFHHRCKMNRTDWEFTTDKLYSFVTEFDLVCNKTALAAFVSSSFFLGDLAGTFVTGTVGDISGRKPLLLFSLLTLIISQITMSHTRSALQLIIVNIVRGLAFSGVYYTVYVYASEIVLPKFRSRSAVLFCISAVFSSLLIDFMAYYERKWRKLFLYAAFPSSMFFILLIYLPESPRWLYAKGKLEKAEKVINTIKRFNGASNENRLKLKLPKKSLQDERKYTYIDLVRNWKVFSLVCRIGTLWFAIPLTYFIVALGSLRLGKSMYESFALSPAVELVIYFSMIFINNRIKRKALVLGSLIGSASILAVMTFTQKFTPNRYILKVVLSSIGRGMVALSFTTLLSWTFELYPTVLRSHGLSVSALHDRIALFCCPFIVRVLEKHNVVLPLVIAVCVALVACFVCRDLPETLGKPTRERYEDFFETDNSIEEIGKDNISCNRNWDVL